MEMIEEVRLGGPRSRSGYFGVDEKLLSLRNSKPVPSVIRYTDYTTPGLSKKHIRKNSNLTHHLLV